MTATTPEQIVRVRELAATGMSARAIGRDVGLSHVTVSKLLRADSRKPPQGEAAVPADKTAEPTPDESHLDFARRCMRESQAIARAARAAGNFAAAQKASRDTAQYAAIVARLERTAIAEADLLRFSRAQIDEAMAALVDRVAAMCDRPLLCASCSRALSVEWGTSGRNSGDGERGK